MWSNPDSGGVIIGRPSASADDHGADKTDDVTGIVDTADADIISDTDTPVTDGATEAAPQPHKFESLFAPEGTVEVTDTCYRSHDIYITVEEVTCPVSDYIARYYIYDVYVRNIENIYTSAVTSDNPSKTPERVSIWDLIEAAGMPIAAVSGDFWGQNAAIAVRNGVLLRNKGKTENDFCVMYKNGVIKTYPGSDLPDFEITDDVYQIWSFGPALLDEDGHARTDFGSKNDIRGCNPRSSIGYYEPGHYCFIVAEGRRTIKYNGRSTYLAGMRFEDLAELYESLGCVAAYNFDGGDSAYGYYNGKIIREDWSRAHEEGEEPRKIYDIICVGEIG